MAQKVVLVDDIDGREGAESVTFAIDGISYEIDLGTTNAVKLRGVFLPYIEAARRAVAPRPPRRTRARANGRKPATNDEIRAWAKAEGIPVKSTGRLPAEAVDRYHGAHA